MADSPAPAFYLPPSLSAVTSSKGRKRRGLRLRDPPRRTFMSVGMVASLAFICMTACYRLTLVARLGPSGLGLATPAYTRACLFAVPFSLSALCHAFTASRLCTYLSDAHCRGDRVL